MKFAKRKDKTLKDVLQRNREPVDNEQTFSRRNILWWGAHKSSHAYKKEEEGETFQNCQHNYVVCVCSTTKQITTQRVVLLRQSLALLWKFLFHIIVYYKTGFLIFPILEGEFSGLLIEESPSLSFCFAHFFVKLSNLAKKCLSGFFKRKKTNKTQVGNKWKTNLSHDIKVENWRKMFAATLQPPWPSRPKNFCGQ